MNIRRNLLLTLALSTALAGAAHAADPLPPRTFPHPDRIRFDGHCLTIDGKDTFIYSGAFHYFRCPKELWAARLDKIKAAGFNCVETYVAWNWCEPEMPASLDDSSKLHLQDLDDFISLAEQHGLYVIVRPGPYICAEWDRGGYPDWLITKMPKDYKGLWLRTDDPTFVSWSKHWFDAVCPIIAKHQITRKSPGQPGVILVQLENEYDYSHLPTDVKVHYVKQLATFARDKGIDVPFITCWTGALRDNPDPALRDVFDSCNFYTGWNVNGITDNQKKLRREQPDAPMMTTELQGGWFTGTSGSMNFSPTKDIYRADLGPSQINNLTLYAIQTGDTITNYYMLFGGTNLGDWNAHGISTTYDYSAPIRECGGVGDKYLRVSALGHMLQQYGTELARTDLLDTSATTDQPDVHVAVRQSADGARFIFVRTDQHNDPRSGNATLKLPSGEPLSFQYDLEPFGSKILYLPPGVSDPAKGEWLPKPVPQIERPTNLPSPINIPAALVKADPGPSSWNPLNNHESLTDLGINGCPFTWYRSTLNLTDADLKKDGPLNLLLTMPTEDAAVARINGHLVQRSPATFDFVFNTASLLHPGVNNVQILYRNNGNPNGGEGMQKRSGIQDIALTPAAATGQRLEHWKMNVVNAFSRPNQLPEIKPAFDDSAWKNVQTNGTQLEQDQSALFRTSLSISQDELAAGKTILTFSNIDDHGWIFVNGQQIGTTDQWGRTYSFDAAKALHPGNNAIAVAVKNNAGNGGLGEVLLTAHMKGAANAPLPLEYALDASTTSNWDAPDLDDSSWTRQQLGAAPADDKPNSDLLTWTRLKFELPANDPHLWLPWCIHFEANGQGALYLNGHPLGRYWQSGQHDFYLPECWLNFGPGKPNVVTVALLPTDKGGNVTAASAIPYTAYAEKR